MIVGFALFNVKKGKEKEAKEHMKHHLELGEKAKGFIHGYIAKSMNKPREYLVVCEYETPEAYEEAQSKLAAEATNQQEFIRFSEDMEKKPLYGLYRKEEFTKTRISKAYKKILQKFHEKKHLKIKKY